MTGPLFDITHRRVVVTGAGSGIGRAVALALSSCGVAVVAIGRRTDALAETAALAGSTGAAIMTFGCDVTDDASVDRVFAAIESDGDGVATGLVHAAAQMVKRPARSMSPAQFREVVTSTLFGSFNVLRRWAEPLFESPSGGAAVMITSNSASRGTPGVSHSSAGKAGVEALTKSLGREWGPYGIRINAVGPGPFPVEKSAAAWSSDGVRARMQEAIALGRYGELHEIVAPVLFLLTSGAGYITGQTMRVDGGLSLTRWSITEEDMADGLNNRYEPGSDSASVGTAGAGVPPTAKPPQTN
jgi:NAD(P)-dependent dehydrogenase (short-subunit alcohol dehydrogenase family)